MSRQFGPEYAAIDWCYIVASIITDNEPGTSLDHNLPVDRTLAWCDVGYSTGCWTSLMFVPLRNRPNLTPETVSTT